jgi:bifunctional DNA-binding transcriptional regulator/antitoxin component of YhaV-PrlF toxin-antitoxin module
MLTFPPEILEDAGWKEGTVLQIEVIDGSLHIREKDGTD